MKDLEDTQTTSDKIYPLAFDLVVTPGKFTAEELKERGLGGAESILMAIANEGPEGKTIATFSRNAANDTFSPEESLVFWNVLTHDLWENKEQLPKEYAELLEEMHFKLKLAHRLSVYKEVMDSGQYEEYVKKLNENKESTGWLAKLLKLLKGNSKKD